MTGCRQNAGRLTYTHPHVLTEHVIKIPGRHQTKLQRVMSLIHQNGRCGHANQVNASICWFFGNAFHQLASTILFSFTHACTNRIRQARTNQTPTSVIKYIILLITEFSHSSHLLQSMNGQVGLTICLLHIGSLLECICQTISDRSLYIRKLKLVHAHAGVTCMSVTV